MFHFYDLPEHERISLTKERQRLGQPVKERWEHLSAEAWIERAKVAAEWLADTTAIADLGCGAMPIRGFIPHTARYVPVDLVRRDEHTLVIDFNTDPLPLLEVDDAVVLGVYEYLFEPSKLLGELRAQTKRQVMSYNVMTDDKPEQKRLADAWVSHHTMTELECAISKSHWSIRDRKFAGGSQWIFLLE